ncbi:MAG TPA: hypothetical protein VI792_04120 [Candidatus Eisenbacteria bacterium]
MAVEATRGTWASRAEAAIKALRDVEGVSIQADGEDIRELHILTTSTRPAKQIVRDVQTLLLTKFNRSIDHRVVSVAYAVAAEPPAPVAPAREAAPPPAPAPAVEEERVRFTGVNLYVAGARVQAQVELKWKGIARTGSATGYGARDGAHRLVAEATIAALQEYLEDELALAVEDASVVRAGRESVMIVSLTLLAHRQSKTLVGCCAVEQDVPQAAVLATLMALNRVVGGLRTKEPTEYVLRPTSA